MSRHFFLNCKCQVAGGIRDHSKTFKLVERWIKLWCNDLLSRQVTNPSQEFKSNVKKNIWNGNKSRCSRCQNAIQSDNMEFKCGGRADYWEGTGALITDGCQVCETGLGSDTEQTDYWVRTRTRQNQNQENIYMNTCSQGSTHQQKQTSLILPLLICFWWSSWMEVYFFVING